VHVKILEEGEREGRSEGQSKRLPLVPCRERELAMYAFFDLICIVAYANATFFFSDFHATGGSIHRTIRLFSIASLQLID